MQNPMVFRVLAGLVGLLFFVQGMGWLLSPAQAAEGLGMPLLDGVGRSTQIGDIGAFFFGLGAMGLIGAWTRNPTWLLAGALLLGGAAVMRTVSVAHGAPFTPQFVGPEVVMGGLLVLCAVRLRALAD